MPETRQIKKTLDETLVHVVRPAVGHPHCHAARYTPEGLGAIDSLLSEAAYPEEDWDRARAFLRECENISRLPTISFGTTCRVSVRHGHWLLLTQSGRLTSLDPGQFELQYGITSKNEEVQHVN